MKNVFYYANNIYQFSYALPIYNRIGGIFVVRNLDVFLAFKRYFTGLKKFREQTLFNTPKVIIRGRDRLHQLDGILMFISNSIRHQHDYKNCITIFHEHGTSDKRHGGKYHKEAKKKLNKYDYIMLSGPKNKLKLEEEGLNIPEEKLVPVGVLRFDKYINGEYAIEAELNRLKVMDRSRKNILYAPTWRFGKGTIKKYGIHFAEQITQKYNLIIRPHFHDQKYSHYLKFVTKRIGIKHLYFSNASNLIKQDTFNDFVVSDLMISDTSGVIYEYLITQKPIIIVKNDYKKANITPNNMDIREHVDFFNEGDDILQLIEHNLKNHPYQKTYKKMVQDCFYDPNGKSVDRAVKFIKKLQK